MHTLIAFGSNMKHIRFFLILAIFSFAESNAFAQALAISDFDVTADGSNNMLTHLDLKFTMPPGGTTVVDDESFDYTQDVDVYSENNSVVLIHGQSISTLPSGIRVTVRFSEKPTLLLQSMTDKIYLYFPNNLRLPVFDAATNSVQLYTIAKEDIKQTCIDKNKTIKDLIAKSNYAHFQAPQRNNIDAGVSVENDGADKTDFALNFNYISSYSNIKFDKSDKTEVVLPLYFEASGLVSSNAKDSLNNIKLYPLSIKSSGKGFHEFVLQAGSESNQTFSQGRAVGNLSYQVIAPNFINLSSGFQRFRLKPVVKIGLKAYTEYDTDRKSLIPEDGLDDRISSVQPFGQLYYYIPVLKSYSFIVDLNAFYETNKKLNASEDVKFNYNLTFGIDIPKTDFKVMFKYQKGTNNITYKDGQQILLGLLLDIMPNAQMR